MTVNINTGFADQDYLYEIRQKLLNPMAVKVKSLDDKMSVVEPLAKNAYTHLDVLTDEKKVMLFSENGESTIDLNGMFREGSDLSVQGDSGPPTQNITSIKFKDAGLSSGSAGSTEVTYNWPGIVADNQVPLKVGTLADGTKATKHLFFRGANQVVYTEGDITTVDVTAAVANPLLASIPSKSHHQIPVPITEIELEGDVDSSNITGSKLVINLNSGGGVAPASVGNFMGFFETLGDLESAIANPVSGKSYAFAKDSKFGGSYYTPYFYVNGRWTELKQDPALTYDDPKTATAAGVFSIKPSEKITIDALGQLDLDGLSTPQIPSHFRGFYDSLDELKASITKPVVNQDWAYVRNSSTGGLLAYRSTRKDADVVWSIIAPLGSIALVDKQITPNNYAQAFGIYRDDQWDMDSKGILKLKPINTKTKAEIVDYEGNVTTGDFDTIQFRSGKSYVNLHNNKLFIDHPQQIIRYDSEFEDDHNTQNYEGNIFYDETSRTWMGWGIPAAAGGVDKKWTRVLHPKMSDEVKDLSRRLPAKAPDVLPGILGDSALWAFNGVTFLEKDSEHLPEDFREICGGYITTSVQDKDQAGVTIPQYRLQTCVADRDEGGTYVRRWKMSGSPGASVEWSKWVRTSFTPKDIQDHNEDASAHSSVFKHYRAVAFSAKLTDFAQQVEGNQAGGVRTANCDLMMDSHTPETRGEDYIDIPYNGTFRIKANFALSGYKEGAKEYPTGRWQALVRVKKKTGVDWRTVGQFIYDHADKKSKFPIMDFEVERVDLKTDDEVIINLTFGGIAAVAKDHPDLAFIPIKSYILVEDFNTHTGFQMCKTYSKHFSTVDSSGAVGIRVHHANIPDATTNIRVYGEKVNKIPVEMQKV